MSENKLKIAFFGSSDFVIPILESIKKNQGETLSEITKNQIIDSKIKFDENIDQEILNKKIELTFVTTQPDRKVRKKLVSNPITTYCRENDIQLYNPENINNDFANFTELAKDLDIGITASFGQILSDKILKIPKYGFINWHPSKLPKYRGATPMQTAIKNGDEQTALSWIVMTDKMDAGKILLQLDKKINNDTNILNLSKEMGVLGSQSWALATAIKILDDKNKLKKHQLIIQNENEASFCQMLTKEDAFVDPNKQTAEEIYNHWKAYTLFPKTKFNCPKFGEAKILEIDNILTKDKFDNLENSDKKTLNSSNWVQLKENKKLRTFLKCKKDYLELKKIGLEDGKMIDFSGYELTNL